MRVTVLTGGTSAERDVASLVEDAGHQQVCDVYTAFTDCHEHDLIGGQPAFWKLRTACRGKPNIVAAQALDVLVGVYVTVKYGIRAIGQRLLDGSKGLHVCRQRDRTGFWPPIEK